MQINEKTIITLRSPPKAGTHFLIEAFQLALGSYFFYKLGWRLDYEDESEWIEHARVNDIEECFKKNTYYGLWTQNRN